jgi:hypothetical protein
MASTTDIIQLWPSLEAFAEDAGVPVGLVRVWKTRKSIPADRWALIERAARRRSITGASASDLAEIASSERARDQTEAA